VQRNLVFGSALCIVVVSMFWAAALFPTRWGIRLVLGGGLLVPATGAVLAVLGFAGAARPRRWAVGSAAANVAYCMAYWAFILA
jgi:hypothetical protein